MMGTTPTPPEWVTNPNWLTEQKTKLWESTGMKSEEYFSQFKSDLAEVTTLKEDYNKAVEAKNQALLREEQRLAPEAVIAGKMSRVEKEANLRLSTMSAQINTKLGIMEMKRGNFTDAQNFVNNAVNDYLTQYKMNVDNFRTFYNVNKDMVDSLKSDYKDIFNKSWDLAKLKLTQEENRTKQIANWIKEVPNANWGSNPLDLTLEDAAQIYQQGSLALAPKTQGNYYWDVQTGTWKLIGEMGGTGLSESLQKDFAEDMSSVSKWGSREAALVGLNNLETALVLKYGRENYQKLLNEVDRLFPAPVEKTKEKSVVLPGTEKTYQVGQATSGLVGSINKQLENLLSPVGETALKVESFFKGLFGR
jgi:hypothetical protein